MERKEERRRERRREWEKSREKEKNREREREREKRERREREEREREREREKERERKSIMFSNHIFFFPSLLFSLPQDLTQCPRSHLLKDGARQAPRRFPRFDVALDMPLHKCIDGLSQGPVLFSIHVIKEVRGRIGCVRGGGK